LKGSLKGSLNCDRLNNKTTLKQAILIKKEHGLESKDEGTEKHPYLSFAWDTENCAFYLFFVMTFKEKNFGCMQVISAQKSIYFLAFAAFRLLSSPKISL